MKRVFVFAVLLLMLCSSALALSNPINSNGKTYYVVSASDPTEDTGDEVCAKVGMACLGYTDTSSATCLQDNPGAASYSSGSGDASGVYCNGAPQNGVCATLTNTCATCPTCTKSVACNEPIGGLYNEMFVECGAGQCKVNLKVTSVQDLINQVPTINAQLQGCSQSVPSFAKSLVKSGVTQIDILMNNGQTNSFAITIANGAISGITVGVPSSCSQKISVSESDLTSALASSNPAQAYAYLYGQGKIKVSGCSFFSNIGFFFGNLIAKPVAKKAAPSFPPPAPAPNCGQVGEQCNNRGCFSGMCGAPKEQNNDKQWGYWNYRCIDQNDYTNYCLGHGNSPAAWNCYTGVCS